MVVKAAVPVTVTEEAAAHVAHLGYEEEFKQILEHTCQALPGLRGLSVHLEPPNETSDEEVVLLEADIEPAVYEAALEPLWQWYPWRSNTFGPDVARHFALI